MRAIEKLITEFDEDRKYHKSIWHQIYLSDWFDPIYKLSRIPGKIKLYIEKFFYYGKIGASQCYDFDAGSIDTLIHAHMVRVQKFMHSDSTHLMWNSDKNYGSLMKKLDEFVELSRRASNNELDSIYNFSKVSDEVRKIYGDKNLLLTREEYYKGDYDYWSKKKRLAIKKDQKVTKAQKERYYYMLQHYVPRFWD
jgi:hypothetical protein